MTISEFLSIVNFILIKDRNRLKLNNKGHLLIHKQIENSTSFKAIKTHTWRIVYYTSSREQELLKVVETFNSSKYSLEEIESHMTKKIVEYLLNYLKGDNYKLLLEEKI
jgi:hypothetical protein